MRADPRPIPPPSLMQDPPLTVADDWLETLFLAHYAGLVRLVSGLLDDNETCEEVVQDAFAALARIERRPKPGREAAYLRSAALNGARSQLRKRRVRRRHLHAVPDLSEAAEVAAVQRVENQEILAAIRELPRRQSEVLLLRYQADLDEAEIAATLGISPGSVKTHASRGLAAVRSRLEEVR
ncbi:MAG: sigma-70 family RNA polymerase sigma factor [Acidimicrobiales bacterium]|nr:sigma-70 family RNA polymerase sigma factor [Acidimicrobiales bacterium]